MYFDWLTNKYTNTNKISTPTDPKVTGKVQAIKVKTDHRLTVIFNVEVLQDLYASLSQNAWLYCTCQ